MNILFESDLFDEEKEVWLRHGASVHEGLFDDRKLNKFTPTVARGSIQFHNSVGFAFKTKGWPDLRWPFNFNWSVWGYHYLKNFPNLLNADAMFKAKALEGLVIEEFTPETLYKNHFDFNTALRWPIWIRSVSGAKAFTGGVYTREEFEGTYEFLKQENLINTPLVVAKPKEIHEEHRLIFVGGELISWSRYHADGRKPMPGDCFLPRAIEVFGIQWVKDYGHNWQGHFVLDIATTNYGPKVIEVNNLLTSGWYAADTESIVEAIVKEVNKHE